MFAENIHRAGRWFPGNVQQIHVRLLHSTPTFAMVAVWAGSHNVCPNVFPAHMARLHVVHRQPAVALSAILAGIIVAAKDFATRQLDVWARSMNLVLQSNDRRTREQLFDRTNVTTSIHDHIGFACQEQPYGPPRGTNIDRLKVGVED